jgi:hypothetical protein
MFTKFFSWLWACIQQALRLQPCAPNPIVENVISFYAANYRLVDANIGLRPTDKRYLGNRAAETCRFCGKSAPEVKFSQETHALPEATGNKSVITYYECDTCNDKFGGGIDTEFGKWSKPLRTFYQVRGKDGVPTLKREGPTGWRIELKHDGFIFQQHEENPVVQIDEAKEQVTIEVLLIGMCRLQFLNLSSKWRCHCYPTLKLEISPGRLVGYRRTFTQGRSIPTWLVFITRSRLGHVRSKE